MQVQIEIRPRCPGCGDKRYRRHGQDENWISRKCVGCGYIGKVLRLTQGELLGMLLDRKSTRLNSSH